MKVLTSGQLLALARINDGGYRWDERPDARSVKPLVDMGLVEWETDLPVLTPAGRTHVRKACEVSGG